MRFADLDAITVDGYGTLLRLLDPVPSLVGSLARRGIEHDPELVRSAFAAEVAYYRPEAVRGRDAESLARLRCDCAGVFLRAAGVELEPEAFVDDFMASIRFESIPGALEALESLQHRGLELAVVSNWDIGLPEHLERIGADRLFSAIVTSAEAGAAKPDPAVFRLALERLRVEPGRALHVGDEPEDEQGAAAVGMRFAPAPLATAFASFS
ncbi:MAG TPA: HAD-IA family hydrolase [Gaiellaceae bacterium]|jgi:putative hydrolase of the HAD superfamily